jgi:hypothetical protein
MANQSECIMNRFTYALLLLTSCQIAPAFAAHYDIDATRSYIEIETAGSWQNVGVYDENSPLPDNPIWIVAGEGQTLFRWELSKTVTRVALSGRIGFDLVESDYTPGVFRAFRAEPTQLSAAIDIPDDVRVPFYMNYSPLTGALNTPPGMVDNDGFLPYMSCLCFDMGPTPDHPRTYYSGSLSDSGLTLGGVRSYGMSGGFFLGFDDFDYVVAAVQPDAPSFAGTPRIQRIVIDAGISPVPEARAAAMWAAGLALLGGLARTRNKRTVC